MEPARDRFMHSFMFRPQVHFETQQEGEEVILMLRAHPVTQLSWIINSVLLLIILFIVNFFGAGFLAVNQLLGINIFAVIFIVSFVWINYLSWYFNVGIITNKRIIDVDFSNILYKEVNIAQLEKVEDITSKSAGYFGALFHYGNVFIQTAGFEVNIEFLNIPEPSEVIHVINDLIKK